MQMPDVNILIYAHRKDERSHTFYRQWIESLINSREPFALSSFSAVAFVRIVTHSSFPGGATPLAQAIAVVESLRSASNCRFLMPSVRHWALTRSLCEESKATGKIVSDAQHAAVALEHGCTWITRDEDFTRFISSGLRVRILKP